LLHDPSERSRRLACTALALRRDEADIVLPAPETSLAVGDQILCVGSAAARAEQELCARNRNALHYLLTGQEEAGWLWRRLMPEKSRQTVQ